MLTDRVIFACIIVLAAGYFYGTAQIPTLEIGDPLGPKAFPRLLGIGLLITAVMLFFEMRAAAKEQPPVAGTPPQDAGKRHLWVIGGVTAWTAVYIAVFEPLGYMISTAIYLLGLTAYFHRGKWLSNVLTSVLFSIGTYLLFVKVFGVMLAKGVLNV